MSSPDAVLSAWNDTARAYRSDALIHQLVDEGADRDPAAPALAQDGRVLDHGTVRRRSDQVAALLHRLGTGPGDVVGLYARRTPEAVIGLLGVLKAGAAYVPLDVRWPRSRVRDLLQDLGATALLTDSAGLPVVDSIAPELPALRDVLCLDVTAARTWEPALHADAVRELWDDVAADEDEMRAAGFNVGRGDGHRYTEADALAYRDHVSGLARGLAGDGAAVLEVGAGSGLVLRALAGWAGRVVAVDPAPAAVRRVASWAPPHVEVSVGLAHEIAGPPGAPVDLAVLASVTQFFPDAGYLADSLEAVAGAVRPGGRVLVADVPDPAASDHPGLRTPVAFFDRLVRDSPRFAAAAVLPRPPLAGDLRHRYDVVLEVADPAAAPRRRDRHTWADVLATRDDRPRPATTSRDLAYVLFTSGSTGRPKGVEIEHRSVVNLIDWVNREFGVGPADRVLFVTAFAFDLSVYDLFGVLAAGGCVHVVADDDLAEPERLLDLLESEPITFWDSAPAALSVVLPFAELRPARGRDTLRRVFLSGDWVPLSTHAALARTFPRARLVALGGATEATVWSNAFVVDRVEPDWPSVPYGTPMQNARYHVLDADLAEVPVGVPGDLWIAGDCLARGYAGDPELTAAKFRTVRNERMYRTGDRAQWLPDGVLRFLGRLDDQVKIRGYRVELGEVRAALARCAGVVDAVVLAAPGADGPEMAGFFRTDRPLPPDDVRAQLAELLPPYLVPSRLVRVGALPLSATGKVDRAALLTLLAPAARPAAAAPAVPAPEDGATATVVAAWARVLGTPPSSHTDSFFALGGTSLAAARLAALVQERSGAAITVRDVFARPSVQALTELIGAAREAR